MSEILSNAPDNASPDFTVRPPLSDRDKVYMEMSDAEHLLTRDMRDLLIMPAICYCGFTDDALYRYLKGSVLRFRRLQVLRVLACCAGGEDERIERYTREMRLCNQVICRIRREFARRGAKCRN